MLTTVPESQLHSHLMQNEEMRWSGSPKRGLRFGKSDLLVIPIGVFWGVFAFEWEYNAIPFFLRDPLVALFGLPFVVVASYLLVGRFFFDDWLRKNTIYAVTNQRVLVLQAGHFRSFMIRDLQVITLEDRGDGTGSIWLSKPDPRLEPPQGFPTDAGPELARLPNASKPYKLILELTAEKDSANAAHEA